MTDDGRFTDSYSANRELRIESRRCEPLDPRDYSHLTSNKVKLHTPEKFELDVWTILEEAGQLLLSKHADYGPTNISNSPGGPINGLRVRIHDKTARINNLIDNSKDPKHESLRDSFIDLLNYSAIALLVLENKWPSE